MGRLLRRHGAFLLLWAAACVAMLWFAWGEGIATVSDDSVSYLVLAQSFAGDASPFVREWVGYEAHFPPLFPLVLAMAGAAHRFAAAHVVVAVFALLSLIVVYAYANRRLGARAYALGVVILFLLAPTAWISIKGILSESQYLFFSMAAIAWYEARLADEDRARTGDWLAFGGLLALAYLTRAAAVALVAAYAVHVGVRMVRGKRLPMGRWLLPGVPVIVLVGAWIALRPPLAGDNYTRVIETSWRFLVERPGFLLTAGAENLAGGWMASFNASPEAQGLPWAVFMALGLLGVAGAVRRALANRLDGWYVLLSLAMIWFWLFPPENMRRLLYPLVPLLLVQAADFVLFLLARIEREQYAGRTLALAAVVPALYCIPAMYLLVSKARETAPVVPGSSYSYADIKDYYTTIRLREGRSVAARHIALISGLQSLERVTPAGSRVMWVRPDYVSLLGNRQGIPWYYREGKEGLLAQLRARKADYLVMSSLYKDDMRAEQTDPPIALAAALAFGEPVVAISNPVVGGYEFVLLRIDPDRIPPAP